MNVDAENADVPLVVSVAVATSVSPSARREPAVSVRSRLSGASRYC